MFDREFVSVRFADIKHRTMKTDDAEVGLVEITFEISPFTKELAKELDDFVRRTLFTATDAEVTRVRMAPDQGEASFVIDEAKIGVIHARRSKKTSTWRCVFTATCVPASEHQLAQIVDCYTKARYITTANAEPGLFDDQEKADRKRKAKDMPSRGGGSPDSATAH